MSTQGWIKSTFWSYTWAPLKWMSHLAFVTVRLSNEECMTHSRICVCQSEKIDHRAICRFSRFLHELHPSSSVWCTFCIIPNRDSNSTLTEHLVYFENIQIFLNNFKTKAWNLRGDGKVWHKKRKTENDSANDNLWVIMRLMKLLSRFPFSDFHPPNFDMIKWYEMMMNAGWCGDASRWCYVRQGYHHSGHSELIEKDLLCCCTTLPQSVRMS